MMLKWATTNCGQAKYLMKTDDDMFINIPVLVKLLQARSKPDGALVGSLICNAKPIVDPTNKWYVNFRTVESDVTHTEFLSIHLFKNRTIIPCIDMEIMYVNLNEACWKPFSS